MPFNEVEITLPLGRVGEAGEGAESKALKWRNVGKRALPATRDGTFIERFCGQTLNDHVNADYSLGNLRRLQDLKR